MRARPIDPVDQHRAVSQRAIDRRVVANPMYVGLVLAYLGEAGMLKQVWPVVLLPLTVASVNWIVIPVEEARLRGAFGEEYKRYRASVRRWI